jgi:hypothetical protein
MFWHMSLKKCFKRYLMRRSVYICLFLAFFSVGSVIMQKFELVFAERLEKQIYKDKIPAAPETISYADFCGGSMWDRQVGRCQPGRSTSGRELFLIVSPVEQGNNEINVLVTIIEPDHNDLSEDVFNRPADRESELAGNLVLTPEEKLSLIDLLNTLTDSHEPNQLQSAQSED